MLVILLLAGCSGLDRAGTLPPQVTVADLRLVEAGLIEQEFELALRLANPNNFDLALEGLRFRLRLNERDFLEGGSSQPVTVPRLGEALATVRGRSTTFDIVQQAMALTQASEFRYALDGVAFPVGTRSGGLAFARRGELRLTPASGQRFEPLR